MDTLLIVLAAIVFIVIVLAIFGAFSSSSPPPSRPRPTLRKTPSSAPPVEGIIGLLLLGAVGFAAYKFIQSGGLQHLKDEVRKVPISIDGKSQSIATLTQNDSSIEEMLARAIERKIREVFERGEPIETLNQNTPRAAADVAQMLKDALESRIRKEGI